MRTGSRADTGSSMGSSVTLGRSLWWRVRSAVLVAPMLVAGACGGDGEDTADQSSAETDSAAEGQQEEVVALESLDEVYAELEGLEGEERAERLLALAQAESGEFLVYLTTEERVSSRWLETFVDKTAIDAESYRASSSDLLQRLTEEAEADFQGGADVVLTNGPEMIYLDQEVGIFAPLTTPVTDDLTQETVFENWAGYSANAHMVMWNSNSVSPEQMPATIEELLLDPPERMILEGRNWEWFATLVTKWLMDEQGMTEEEAIDVFRQAMPQTAITQGHDFLNTFVVSGEYDVSATSYINAALALVEEGAPVEWLPAVEPLVARPAGGGIHVATDRPASSLLFLEHMFTDVQPLLIEDFFIPLSTTVEGSSLLDDHRVVFQDTERLQEESDYWQPLWEELLTDSESEEPRS